MEKGEREKREKLTHRKRGRGSSVETKEEEREKVIRKWKEGRKRGKEKKYKQ